MEENISDVSGVEDFKNASDAFYKYLAGLIREAIEKKNTDLDTLRELSDLIKVNSENINIQSKEIKTTESSPKKKKKESPLEKMERMSGSQVPV